MELAIFAKKRTTKEGKTFYTYLTQMVTKTGEAHTVSVKFREDCGTPKAEKCPMIINVDKKAANMVNKELVVPDTGEALTTRTLWVSAWKECGPYVDHSLDDYI